jgi:hypothetical protein
LSRGFSFVGSARDFKVEFLCSAMLKESYRDVRVPAWAWAVCG